MASNSSPHPEEYVKIMANVNNIEHVWGRASGQYREADAMASEYLRNFMGVGQHMPVSLQETQSGEVVTGGLPKRKEGLAMNLALRPKILK